MSNQQFETIGQQSGESHRFKLFKLVLWSLLFTAAVAIGGYFWTKSNPTKPAPAVAAQTGQSSLPSLFGGGKKDEINVCVVTWGGYAGGQYFNRGFEPNPQSEFTKQYGLNVRFTTMDDFQDSRDAWKNGKCNLLWVTVDAFTTEAENLTKAGFKPVFTHQVDWSRGGDAIVVRQGIKSMADLKGKKVTVTFGTPSHTFLLRMMSSAGLKPTDVTLVETGSAPAAAQAFKTGAVDAAVVWSPDDEAAIKAVPGAKVLVSTKEATHIIADGFFADKDYVASNRDALTKLVKGWLAGNAEINSSPAAKAEAAKILAAGYNLPLDEATAAIGRVRLVTVGDNRQFLGIDGGATMTADKLFTQSAALYRDFGYQILVPSMPNWRDYSDLSIVSALAVAGANDAPEGAVALPKVVNAVTAEAITTKALSVSFKTASAELDEESKFLIQQGFLQDAQASQGTLIRIEGNTDAVGNRASNVALSKRRAESVANVLVGLGIPRERMIVVGNGPDKPVCAELAEACNAQNRRTDFSLVK